MQLATRDTLTEIRRNVEDCKGKRVILKTNKGKRKYKEREGILEGVYNNVFVVKLDGGMNSERNIAFSYSDILTETVELTLCENLEKIHVS